MKSGPRESSCPVLGRPRHVHLLEDGIADLQVAGEEPSIAGVDAYLSVWLFIVTASSIFDCNFVVPAT